MGNIKRIEIARKRSARAHRNLEIQRHRRQQAEKGNVVGALFGKPKKFIKKIGIKKGALSRQLKIPQKDNIPKTLLDKIIEAKAGDTIRNPTKSGRRIIKVTRKLERRAILARNLKRFKK